VKPTSGSQHFGDAHVPSYAAVEHGSYRHVELLEEGVDLVVELDADLRPTNSARRIESSSGTAF